MAETLYCVDVFVREVEAACKGDVAVDYHELSVVAVIHDHRQNGHQRVKAHALDAEALEVFVVMNREL